VRPKASWAGLICRTCLHLKRQILPHNGHVNVPADQWVKLETDLWRKGLEKKISFKTRMKCTIKQVTDWSMMWIIERWDRTCRWNTKRWRKLIPQVRSCMPEWAFRDLEIWLNWWVKESDQWWRPCGSGWLNDSKITEVVWSRRLKKFICDRDDFVFYVIWYLEPVKWFQNLVGIRRPGCCNDGTSKWVLNMLEAI